jgi:hypothetical protein
VAQSTDFRISQFAIQILQGAVAANLLVSQFAILVISDPVPEGGLLLNPDLTGGFRSMAGGFNR